MTAASGADRESLVCLGAWRSPARRGRTPGQDPAVWPSRGRGAGRMAGSAGPALVGASFARGVDRHAGAAPRRRHRAARAEPPGLRSEPSVFGASTGCEIFVELVRRAVSSEAIAALGGEGAHRRRRQVHAPRRVRAAAGRDRVITRGGGTVADPPRLGSDVKRPWCMPALLGVPRRHAH